MNMLYIHVGVHKTGTTALQYSLATRRAALKEQGISYPAAGIPAAAALWGHHDLAWALRDGDPGGLCRMVRAEIGSEAGTPSDRAVLSSEEFCLLRNATLFQPLKDAFSGWAFRPICYIRRQDQLLESVYNHHVKSLGETSDIIDFARRIRRRLDHRMVLGRLEQAFGRDTMTVRLYDKALIGDTVSDFFSLLGAEYRESAGSPDINAGLTTAGIGEMLAANRRLAGHPAELQAVRTEIVRTHSSRKFSEHRLLTDAERESIMTEFRPSNREVVEKYLAGSQAPDEDLSYQPRQD